MNKKLLRKEKNLRGISDLEERTTGTGKQLRMGLWYGRIIPTQTGAQNPIRSVGMMLHNSAQQSTRYLNDDRSMSQPDGADGITTWRAFYQAFPLVPRCVLAQDASGTRKIVDAMHYRTSTARR